MSIDSSRQIAALLKEPTTPSSNSSTLMPGSKRNAAVQIALQSMENLHDEHVSTMTIEPRSGRSHVARLPVVEKEVYRIEGEVAQGGIGRVLSARDGRLDRTVAVKVLLEDSGAYEDRFVREALVTARLQHPSIVPVYEAGRWPTGEPFYSMKLVSGKPLLEIIEKTTSLEERLPLLTRVLAVADAMAYAHERRIIHRDLKPANILAGAHGETVLIDWGLAKDLNEEHIPSVAELVADPNATAPENNALTMIGSVMGTPAYMPPEQASGAAVDERADVYALGAILYHVLSGKQPYAGYNGMQTIMRVLEEPPKSLEALQGGIPRDLLAIIDKAMHRERDARYPTAKEFAEDLRRYLTGQLVGAHHYSSKERVLRFVRKNRTAFGVGGVAVMLMVLMGALNVSRIMRERDRAETERQRAEIAKEQATAHADELTLVQARAAVERDPNAALAWLKVLSPSFRKWNSARVIAADAWSRGTSTTWRNHKETINMMALSRDEKFFVTASDDHTACIVDFATGQSRVLAGHTDEVWSVTISSDGRQVMTAGKDHTIRLWDVATGKITRTLEGSTGGIIHAVFSPDNKFVFSHSDDYTLSIWDLATGKDRVLASGLKMAARAIVAPDGHHCVTTGIDGSMWYVGLDGSEPKRLVGLSTISPGTQRRGRSHFVMSPDSQKLLVGSAEGFVQLWDKQTEKVRIFEGQTKPIVRVAFSPDGKYIAAASVDGSLRIWNVEMGTARVLPSLEAGVHALEFSSDGRMLLVAGDDKTVRVFDLSTEWRRRFVGMQDTIPAASFTKDGSRFLVASGEGAVRVFRVHQESGRLLGKHEGRIFAVDVSNRGDDVASAGSDGFVRIWRAREQDVAPITLAGHVGAVPIAKFSPGGDLLVSSGLDGTVRLWDRSGHQIRGILVPDAPAARGAVSPDRNTMAMGGNGLWLQLTKVAFSPDGNTIAIGGPSGLVQLWDVDSGALRELGQHEGGIAHLSFSSDGRLLGTAGADKVAKVWNIESGKSTDLRGHESSLSWIAFSPDTRTIATGSWDHRLRLWDPGASEPRVYDASGHRVQSLSFAADGASILGFNGTSSARLWEVSSGNLLRVFRGHRGNITSLVDAKDGSVFASGGDDHTVRLTDIETGESRVMGVHDATVRAVGIDPNGQWVVSAGDDGTVRLWLDDLPREPEALRAWITSSVTDVIDVDMLREGSVPLP